LHAAPELPDKFWKLKDEIRTILTDGALDGSLKQSFREIEPLIRNSREPDEYGVASIAGGDRHEVWAGNNQIERGDGARFNFAIHVGYPTHRAPREVPELLSYHFNMAFQDGHQPLFIRFDLNEAKFVTDVARTDVARDAVHSPLLCHMHPGHTKMTVPSMVLSPQEVLDILLRGHLR
jgi:hypothetical protein